MCWQKILNDLNQVIVDELEVLAPRVLDEETEGTDEDKEWHCRLIEATKEGMRGERKWFGFPGASEREIAAKEAELGIRFPDSYRGFLKASNGFLIPGSFFGVLLPVFKVKLFGETNPWICNMWMKVSDAPDFAAEKRLASLARVSPQSPWSSDYVLVEPMPGPLEWPATAYQYWKEGPTPFATFAELIIQETNRLKSISPI